MRARVGKVRALQLWRQRRMARQRRSIERDDVLAYLSRKRANALMLAERSPDFEDEARWTVRQIEIFADDIRAGLHLGEAQIQAGAVHEEV